MKIKNGFELRNICGENIIISHGKENINFTKIISLNESAALIWNQLADKDFSIDDMVHILTSEYEVDENDLSGKHIADEIGLPHEIAHGSLRLSLGMENTEEEVETVLNELPKIVENLRAMSPLTPAYLR